MGANIYFRPVKPKNKYAVCSMAPQSFMETMRKAFGDFPCELSEADLQKLNGMAIMFTDDCNPYTDLIDAINKHGTIEVYAEY